MHNEDFLENWEYPRTRRITNTSGNNIVQRCIISSGGPMKILRVGEEWLDKPPVAE